MAGLKGRLAALRRQAGQRPGGMGEARNAGPAGPGDPEATDAAHAPGQRPPIAQRLARLRPGGRASGAEGPAPVASPPKGVGMAAEEVADALGGEVVAPGVVRFTHHIPLSRPYGRIPLGRWGEAPPAPLRENRPFDPLRAACVDTETTGLAGGAGTVAFLIGIGRQRGEAFRLTLFLITAFAGEPAMLAALMTELAGAETLVSYNGKSFDLPLLAARYRLAGLQQDLTRRHHLDLLHPTRAAFRRRWPDCRLQSAEARLLGVTRHADLPGEEAPLVWGELMRFGSLRRMPALLDHNRNDLLALAALLPALGACITEPAAHGADPLGVARLHQRFGGEEAAFRLLLAQRETLDPAGQLALAHHHRQRGEWAAALALWRPLAEADHPEALERLAKYWEHVGGDIPRALALSRRLLAVHPHPDHARRLQRLQRKLGKPPSGA